MNASKTDRFCVVGYLSFLKRAEQSFTYESCAACKKKVTLENDLFSCNGCQKVTKECNYKY